MYYQLYFSEKDGIKVEQFATKENLIMEIEDCDPADFLTFAETKLKEFDSNGGYYPSGKRLIIKGEVIEPKPAKLTVE